MIKNLRYITKNNIFLSFTFDGESKEIRFSDIEPFWSYATEEDFERSRAKVYGNDRIVFSMLTAGGQGGVIIIWNAKENKVEHVSNGDYCVAFLANNGTLFSLCYVSNFVTPGHLQMYAVPIGTMDIDCSGKRLHCHNPCKVNICRDKFDIKLDEGRLLVIANGDEYEYSSTISDVLKQPPASGFEYLYTNKAIQPKDVSKYRDMLT